MTSRDPEKSILNYAIHNFPDRHFIIIGVYDDKVALTSSINSELSIKLLLQEMVNQYDTKTKR